MPRNALSQKVPRHSRNDIFDIRDNLYWRMMGTIPKEEAWFMSEAEFREEIGPVDAERKIVPMKSINARLPEDIIALMTSDELQVFHRVLSVLDTDFVKDMSGMERMYHAIEYIRYLRWLKYAMTVDTSSFSMRDIQQDTLHHKKQIEFFERLTEILNGREEMNSKALTLEPVLVEEDEKKGVKKIKYEEVYHGKGSDARSEAKST